MSSPVQESRSIIEFPMEFHSFLDIRFGLKYLKNISVSVASMLCCKISTCYRVYFFSVFSLFFTFSSENIFRNVVEIMLYTVSCYIYSDLVHCTVYIIETKKITFFPTNSNRFGLNIDYFRTCMTTFLVYLKLFA